MATVPHINFLKESSIASMGDLHVGYLCPLNESDNADEDMMIIDMSLIFSEVMPLT